MYLFFRKIVLQLLGLIFKRNPRELTATEQDALVELKATFQSFPKFISKSNVPSENEWTRNINELTRLVLEDDPRCFLRWDLVLYTMFPAISIYAVRELMTLRRSKAWNVRWKCILEESPVGCPFPFLAYPRSSGNVIHLAYHLNMFESLTQCDVAQQQFVVEFGAGYGRMCSLLYALGFKGKYICFDLPPFSALQTYYLKCLGHPVLSENDFTTAEKGILCISDFQQLQRVVQAHNSVPGKMFIATWSLSETPLHIRQSVQDVVNNFDAFLMTYQSHFNEVNNAEAFDEWKAKMGVRWTETPVPFLKGNKYLFGRKAK